MVAGLRMMILVSLCLIFATAQAWAVSLGKIEVTNHLGETFFAEVPLQLDAGEKISNVFVGLADASDYQVLEVFRDPAVNDLQVEIKNDLRGPRVVVSSVSAIDTPYFNLVIKVRHGHATNFKKYPVFLDLPDQVRPAPVVAAPVASPPMLSAQPATRPQARPLLPRSPIPVASVSAVRPAPIEAPAPELVSETPPASTRGVEGTEFAPFEGWARTSRYGPMVRGDSITTVARRLPVDERYTLNQIMVGLYNKNKAKFREGNINLINAGTYLDIPTAGEVEAVEERQAQAVLKEHNRRWKQLKNQPRYAAEAEAQKNRYRPRVHIGKSASGEASAPMQNAQAPVVAPVQADNAAAGQFRALQEENLRLKQDLQAAEQKAAVAKPASADVAVAEAKVKKLELTVVRLQRQLTQINRQLEEANMQDANILTSILMAMIVLLLGVAGYLLYLLRRDRPHPAMQMAAAENTAVVEPEFNEPEPTEPEPVDMGTNEPAFGEQQVDTEIEAAELETEPVAEVPDTEADGGDVTAAPADDALLFENKQNLVAEAGVDYLAEADVYLRYGMEDEALQQLNLAIEQRPDNAEAHAKLVQMLQARGDSSAVNAAIDAARLVLGGAALQSFEATIGAEAPSDADGGDTQPDDVSESADSALSFDDGGEASTQDADVSLVEADNAAAETAGEMDLDLSGIDVSGLGDFGREDAAADDEQDEPSGDVVFDVDSGTEETAVAAEDAQKAPADVDDFASSIQLSAVDADDAGATHENTGANISEGIAADDSQAVDFTLAESTSLDDDLNEALSALDAEGDDSQEAESAGDEAENTELAERASEETEPEATESVVSIAAGDDVVAETTLEDDDLNLDDILGDLDVLETADSDEDVAPQLASAGESVPETKIETALPEDDLNLDEILGDLDAFETPDSDQPTSTETASTDDAVLADDLNLDEILGDLNLDDDEPTVAAIAPDDQGAGQDTDTLSVETDASDMDISDELDGLLAEWDGDSTETAGLDAGPDAGPENLDIDRARSLLAEGSLDEAEIALQAAGDSERRGDMLIGLAELAARRGDAARKTELLGEAEVLLDDANRDWFESVKNIDV
ncbi:MAG: FimV/HubP family polar landmark protein [Mariprofundaceae bacterium]|nr:FimV/HubP family polar landmark protein [Mariprofundaceae bacterium]